MERKVQEHSQNNLILILFLLQAIAALFYTSEGDMRKAITYLQSSARLKGEEPLTKEDIYEIAGVSMIEHGISECLQIFHIHIVTT